MAPSMRWILSEPGRQIAQISAKQWGAATEDDNVWEAFLAG